MVHQAEIQEVQNLDDVSEYSAAFAQLRNVKLSFEGEDPCAEDPKLINALAALNAAMSNQLGPIIQQHVSGQVTLQLSHFMSSGMN